MGIVTLQNQIVFKGGTSLSKVHHLIDRFSEDIDLVLNWELLGYGKGKSDPWAKLSSKTQLDKFNKEFNQKAARYVESTLLTHIRSLLKFCPDVRAEISGDDGQVISIHYPASFQLQSLRPEVRLEIGPLTSWVPSGSYTIRSFAAEEFPHLRATKSSKLTINTWSRCSFPSPPTWKQIIESLRALEQRINRD